MDATNAESWPVEFVARRRRITVTHLRDRSCRCPSFPNLRLVKFDRLTWFLYLHQQNDIRATPEKIICKEARPKIWFASNIHRLMLVKRGGDV
jgi:hypothetical protein